jgi:hypothetical protein
MEREEDANSRSVFFRLGATFNADLAAVSFDESFRYE